MLDPAIFREYDIRGIAGENLNSQVCTILGAAYGTMVGQSGGRRVVVGRDGRTSSAGLSRALISGLVGTGCEVMDTGVVTTPMVYFAMKHLGADGGLVVTASHNPPQYNGLKLRKGTLPLTGEEIQGLRKRAEQGPFNEGSGSLSREHGLAEAYLAAIEQRVCIKGKFKVVVDAGNGTAGLVAPELFRRLGCGVVELYCDLDGRFPHHLPDPSEANNMRDLAHAVLEHKADLGFGYDGDADRLGLVTGEGEILSGDLIVALIAGEMLKHEQGTVVFDMLSSRALIDVIEAGGGVPHMAPTGYTRVMGEVKRSRALVGGEASGHIFFGDELFDFDDGIFASVKLLEAVSRSGCSVSELRSEIPRYCSAPEVRLPCADEYKFAVMDRVRQHFDQRYELVDLDGLRIELEGGWASVRASHTSPSIGVVFEAETPQRLEEVKILLKHELAECCAGEISSGILAFDDRW